ncbi:hypothetical protein JHK85_001157 [Glycine max]|nr:hypothetical protein JHK85_001157 [Glycine max]
MIGQAMESFIEWQHQQNEQFWLSMQNVITTQFSSLGVILLQNIQQAQMSMLGVVVAPASVPQPPLAPQPLEPPPLTFGPTPQPLSSSPPPPPPAQDGALSRMSSRLARVSSSSFFQILPHTQPQEWCTQRMAR